MTIETAAPQRHGMSRKGSDNNMMLAPQPVLQSAEEFVSTFEPVGEFRCLFIDCRPEIRRALEMLADLIRRQSGR